MENPIKKIIHIDMDCFYAAIEIRDFPAFADKPLAVGGAPEERGVICTCNYIARKYGIHAAMPTASAYRLCKDLIVLPVNMPKYKAVSQRIQQIFKNYTDLVEPLSLDEAYLDVSQVSLHQGIATLIAKEIKEKIQLSENLNASAGVSINKLLAKIASGWRKPNGLFVIRPREIENFIKVLPVSELFGVGKVTKEKLHSMGIKTCLDLQTLSLQQLVNQFGKLGQQLYDQCRGIDHRSVNPYKERKSISVEHTFPQDLKNRDVCLGALKQLYQKLLQRLEGNQHQAIKNQFIKIKFNNFRLLTAELTSHELNLNLFISLFLDNYTKDKNPIRLIGLGVHFSEKKLETYLQQSLGI